MKEKEFDSLIKNKVDSIDTIAGIEFETPAVWKKINTKIPKSYNGKLYFIITVSIVTLMAIAYFFLFTSSNSITDKKELLIPVEKNVETLIDTVVNKVNIKKTKSVIPKTNKPIEKVVATKKSQIVSTSDTVNSMIDILNKKDTVINKTNTALSNKNKSHHVNFAQVTETRAYIHVYRPGKITGALNMFLLKANGKKIGTITNGEYEVFMVESGLTEFEIKRKKITIDLEARKNYYLRTELIFLGKTKFEQVTESFAKAELEAKK